MILSIFVYAIGVVVGATCLEDDLPDVPEKFIASILHDIEPIDEDSDEEMKHFNREIKKYYKQLGDLEEKIYKKQFAKELAEDEKKEELYFDNLLKQIKQYNS